MGDLGTNNVPIGTGDLEKGDANEIEERELGEDLVTTEEVQHQVLAAAAKPLICTEKIIVSTLIVCFVLVEAYFVGVHFRGWLDKRHHINSTDVAEFVTPLPLQVPLVSTDAVKGNIATPEPFEDFEGGLRSGVTKQIFEAVVKLLPSGQSPRLHPQPTVAMNYLPQKMVREETQF